MTFTDAKFLSAREKELVFKQFKRFIKSLIEDKNKTYIGTYGNDQPVSWKYFTDRIYKHLHLHCGFIAHYSREGFYSEYFVYPEDTITFLQNFDPEHKYYALGYTCEDYRDINRAICEFLSTVRAEFYTKLESDRVERTENHILSELESIGLTPQQFINRLATF